MHGFRHFIDGDARNWCARRRVVWRFTRGLHGRLVLVRPGLWSFNFLPSSTSTIVLWYGMVHLNPFTFDKCSLFIIISCISLLFFSNRFQISTSNCWILIILIQKNSSTAEPRPLAALAGRRARWFETAPWAKRSSAWPWNRRVFYIARLKMLKSSKISKSSNMFGRWFNTFNSKVILFSEIFWVPCEHPNSDENRCINSFDMLWLRPMCHWPVHLE